MNKQTIRLATILNSWSMARCTIGVETYKDGLTARWFIKKDGRTAFVSGVMATRKALEAFEARVANVEW